tara:strand:+ start:124 stop:447 length:324 start_codon:yes stop_codon:yes gene_type:complete
MKDPKVGTGKKPKNSGRRLYTDEDSTDTIPIKFSSVKDVRETISKLERLYKSGKRPHKRISQVAQVLEQRTRFIKGAGDRNKLAKRYVEFLKKRTKLPEKERKKITF